MLLLNEKLQRFLRTLKNEKKCLNDVDYKFIYPSGSAPAKIYGTPKMHKLTDSDTFPKLRPIVFSVGTYNYNLAKYLRNLLSPHLPEQYCTKDTFTFVEELKRVSLVVKFLVSFDVTSLFTNIPLSETIKLAVDLIKTSQPDLNISEKDLTSLFNFATCEITLHFLFKGKFYDQIDGVAMGSPLAPVLANLFMGHYEKECLSNYDGVLPSYYTRYVDDIFSVFNSHDEAKRFFSYLNSRHPNVKFTMEKEVNQVIPFLDVLIDNRSNILNTTTYHKSTYSGLLLNFDSFTSRFYKISLIKCLIDRAYKINNTWASFHNDVTKIKETLKRNSFPPFLIDKITKPYLNKVHSNSDQSNRESDKRRFYKLPYIGKYSEQVQKKLSKICKQFCKDPDLKIVFTSFKINNYFSTKDKTPYFLKSFLVYKFVCARCNSCYIGETCRHFKTRIDEHVKKDKKSNIYKHLNNNEECFSSFNSDCFSILDYAPTQFQVKIKEGMYIAWEKPNLNKQLNHLATTLSI